MNPNLQTAILEFLANEFHLDVAKISPDLNLETDLHLTPDQINDLFQRMQDALNFSLPDEKIPSLVTVADLFSALSSSGEEPAADYDETD